MKLYAGMLVFLLCVAGVFAAQPPDAFARGGNIDRVTMTDYVSRVPSMMVSGTDYEVGDNAKVFSILTESGSPQNNGSCFVEMFYPNSTMFLPFTQMNFLQDGIYYYDFNAPNTTGVYPIAMKCSYNQTSTTFNVSAAFRYQGAGNGAIANMNAIDGIYYNMTEPAASFHMGAYFNFSTVIPPLGNISSVSVQFQGNRQYATFDVLGDNISFWLFNYNTSSYVRIGGDLVYTTVDEARTYTVLVNASRYVSNTGLVQLIINDTTGTLDGEGANSPLDIDLLKVITSATITNQSVTNIAGGGELNIRRHITDIPAAVWNGTNRSLTLYVDKTNYTLINNSLRDVERNINQSIINMGANLTNQLLDIRSSVNSLNQSVNSLSMNLTDGFNGMASNFTLVFSDLSGISSDISSMQSDINSIQSDVTHIRTVVDALNMSSQNLTSVLNAITNLSNNLTVQLNGINQNILNTNDAVDASYINLSQDITSVHVAVNGLSQNVTLLSNFIADINENITNIQYLVETFNASNITVNVEGNLSAINESLTGLIISTGNLPMRFDLNTVLLLLLVVFMIVTIFYNEPGMLVITGIYSVVFGLFTMAGSTWWLGLIIIAIGAGYGVAGFIKLNRNA